MEKITAFSCGQVPACRVLVLLAALPRDCSTQLNDLNEAAASGTELMLVLRAPWFVSQALDAEDPAVLLLHEWQSCDLGGAVLACLVHGLVSRCGLQSCLGDLVTDFPTSLH